MREATVKILRVSCDGRTQGSGPRSAHQYEWSVFDEEGNALEGGVASTYDMAEQAGRGRAGALMAGEGRVTGGTDVIEAELIVQPIAFPK